MLVVATAPRMSRPRRRFPTRNRTRMSRSDLDIDRRCAGDASRRSEQKRLNAAFRFCLSVFFRTREVGRQRVAWCRAAHRAAFNFAEFESRGMADLSCSRRRFIQARRSRSAERVVVGRPQSPGSERCASSCVMSISVDVALNMTSMSAGVQFRRVLDRSVYTVREHRSIQGVRHHAARTHRLRASLGEVPRPHAQQSASVVLG